MEYSETAGLSPRERQIATLVAEGFSNREIAKKLALSVRTVENTLYSTYSKLNVANRTMLALLVLAEQETSLANASSSRSSTSRSKTRPEAN